MARRGGEPLQQEFNRGYDFILNTYGSAQNTMPDKNTIFLLGHGIVIDIDFNITKNYKMAAGQPPFSIYAKIIGEDLDINRPDLEVEQIYYSPLLPIHNLSIPEIGEEIIIMRENNVIGSKGYYFGRVANTATLNYYPAREYMDNVNSAAVSPEFKYGFSFDVNELRSRKIDQMPSDNIESISIPVTFGDVVQQGRTQSYIRHSFNKNNKKGVLEQGLRLQQQNIATNINNDIFFNDDLNTTPSYDPSIGQTATKSIHFVDTSINRLGNYGLASTLPQQPFQDNLDSDVERSMIANVADEIYNISSSNIDPNLYRQVLGEKLISHQKETSALINTMLNGLTGLAETVGVLLDAFVDHEHALPKIELNLEKSITAADRYVVPARYEQQPPQKITVPSRRVRVRTGYDMKRRRAIYINVNMPGFQREVERPPKLVRPARTRVRHKTHKINFEAIIGGEENPRFTAPIQTDEPTSEETNQVFGSVNTTTKTQVGLKTERVDQSSEELIELFNRQKDQLNMIFNKATDFLSKNQFIN